MGLSKMALERCRRMTITIFDDEVGYRALIEVFDARHGLRRVSTYTSRAAIDTERIKRAWVTKFRVPKELITVNDLKLISEDGVSVDGPD